MPHQTSSKPRGLGWRHSWLDEHDNSFSDRINPPTASVSAVPFNLSPACCLSALSLTAAVPQRSRLRRSGVESAPRRGAAPVIMRVALPTFNTSPLQNVEENRGGAGGSRQRDGTLISAA